MKTLYIESDGEISPKELLMLRMRFEDCIKLKREGKNDGANKTYQDSYA
jgi:hypothetical protein